MHDNKEIKQPTKQLSTDGWEVEAQLQTGNASLIFDRSLAPERSGCIVMWRKVAVRSHMK